MIIRKVTLFIALISSMAVYAQNKYSKEDLAAILKKRAEAAKAFKNFDRKAHYYIGAFYEKMHQKYRDTCIYAAVTHYTASTESEGDLMHKESLLAAFRLGEIYGKGLGIRMNIDKAYFYYLLAGKTGEKALHEMRKTYCRDPFIDEISGTRDTFSVHYSPFCIDTSTRFAFLFPYVRSMQENQDLKLFMDLTYPATIHTSYYNYYNTFLAPRFIRQFLVDYLLENNIDPERLIIGDEVKRGRLNYHTMVFRVEGKR